MKNLTKEAIINAIESTNSMSSAAKLLGVCYDTFKTYANTFNLFTPNPGRAGSSRINLEEDVFTVGKHRAPSVLIKRLRLEREWKCQQCTLSTWQNQLLPLELHHINGITTDNRRENLIVLCPNCHAITDNWRSSIKRISRKVSDDDLKNALLSESTIRKALIKVGLAPKGANYNRAYQLLSELLSAPGEIQEVELRKFREALTGNADGNPEPSSIIREGAETRHGGPKSKDTVKG